MSDSVAWCILAGFKITSVFSRIAYHIIESVCELAVSILQAYISDGKKDVTLSVIKKIHQRKKKSIRFNEKFQNMEEPKNRNFDTETYEPIRPRETKAQDNKENMLTLSGQRLCFRGTHEIIEYNLHDARKVTVSFDFYHPENRSMQAYLDSPKRGPAHPQDDVAETSDSFVKPKLPTYQNQKNDQSHESETTSHMDENMPDVTHLKEQAMSPLMDEKVSETHSEKRHVKSSPDVRKKLLTSEQSQVPACPTEESQVPACPTEESQVPACPTEESQVPASPTEESQVPASPTEESRVPASPTEESQAPASPTEESQVPASPTEESQAPASPTEESQAPVSPTEESRAPASPTEESQVPASPTEESQVAASPTEESQVPASEKFESYVKSDSGGHFRDNFDSCLEKGPLILIHPDVLLLPDSSPHISSKQSVEKNAVNTEYFQDKWDDTDTHFFNHVRERGKEKGYCDPSDFDREFRAEKVSFDGKGENKGEDEKPERESHSSFGKIIDNYNPMTELPKYYDILTVIDSKYLLQKSDIKCYRKRDNSDHFKTAEISKVTHDTSGSLKDREQNTERESTKESEMRTAPQVLAAVGENANVQNKTKTYEEMGARPKT